jgi:hypothetical protein
MPLRPTFDTPGLLARSRKAIYAPNFTFMNAYPFKIKALEFPSNAPNVSSRLAIDFLADLKSFMDVTIIALNLKSAWAKGSPDLAPLDMLTNETYTVLITKS